MIRRTGLAVLILSLVALAGGCFLFPNRPPEAVVIIDYNVDPEAPTVVDLNASLSSDPDGDAIVAYMWTFGENVDILTPLDLTKTVDVPVLRVRYPVEDTYTVQLLIRDERGAVSVPVTATVVLPHIPVGPTE